MGRVKEGHEVTLHSCLGYDGALASLLALNATLEHMNEINSKV